MMRRMSQQALDAANVAYAQAIARADTARAMAVRAARSAAFDAHKVAEAAATVAYKAALAAACEPQMSESKVTPASFFEGQGRHALAALALDGLTPGFTWDDVDNLRSLAGHYGTHDPFDPWIAGLADRIESLLPPRAP